MYALLNVGSLLFGLVAWLFPLINLAMKDKAKNKNFAVFSVASVSACAVSLCMQLFNISSLVKDVAWSSLMDTASPIANVSLLLLVVTIVLNAVTIVVYRKSVEQ